jgi:hypothetical protein
MATVTLDLAEFRVRFPAFQCESDATISSWWQVATYYISAESYGLLTGDARGFALELMTAHLALLSQKITTGKPIQGITEQATIDKVSVSLKVAPSPTHLQWWLSLTPYGAQLWALMQVTAAPGMYVGGLPERSAFRKVGGVF